MNVDDINVYNTLTHIYIYYTYMCHVRELDDIAILGDGGAIIRGSNKSYS